MGLLVQHTGLRAGSSRAHQDTICSSALSLLYTLVRKVTKVLKNHMTLASNQKQLVACYNTNHPKHPIILGSVSGSNSGLEGEARFEVQSPHLRADPQSADEEDITPSAGVAQEEGAPSIVAATVGDAADDDNDDGGEGDDGDDDYDDDDDEEYGVDQFEQVDRVADHSDSK